MNIFNQTGDATGGIDMMEGWKCERCTNSNQILDVTCKKCKAPRIFPEAPGTHDVEVDATLKSPDSYGSNTKFEDDPDIDNDKNGKEIRIVLFGRTGSGKSATGNCLLNRQAFRSEVSYSSVTKACKRGTADRFGKKLLIVDTPGLFDTGMDNETVTTEILKCIGISSPGPHAILMVIGGIGRFTREEIETVELLRKAFGHDMHKYMIVVFTRKDDLDLKKKSIEEVVSTAPNHLRQILSDCQNRFMAWNNNANEEENESQCKALLDMIEDMVDDNGGGHYESDMFSEVEVVIGYREMEIRREYEADYRQRLRFMRRQLSSEYHQKVEDCHEREIALTRQLRILQQQSERENRAVQQQLENLREEMNVYTNNMSDSDMANSQILTALKRKIAEVQDSLYEIKQQQRELRYKSEEYCEDTQQEIDDYLASIDFRCDVQGEIERGSKHLLSRFMVRLRGVGTKITDGFRFIFNKMKNNFSSN